MVDFPLPEGPTSAMHSPGPAWSDILQRRASVFAITKGHAIEGEPSCEAARAGFRGIDFGGHPGWFGRRESGVRARDQTGRGSLNSAIACMKH